MKEKDKLLKKIENIDSQIALLSNLKKKLANQLDNSSKGRVYFLLSNRYLIKDGGYDV